MGPRAGWDTMENTKFLAHAENQTSIPPACSVYTVHYNDSTVLSPDCTGITCLVHPLTLC